MSDDPRSLDPDLQPEAAVEPDDAPIALTARRAIAAIAALGLTAALVIGALWHAGNPSASTAVADRSVATAPVPAVARPDFGATTVSGDARALAEHVVARADHGERAFAIVDKSQATLLVFSSQGRLVGASPILLGPARGDESVEGIGDRPIPLIRPEERTTPAGRFLAQPGSNTAGDEIVWVDYDAAVSMHAVRPVVAAERRLERLASPDPAQRRISYGCINVPTDFYKRVAQPAFATAGGVIYVLPETRPWPTLFDGGIASGPPAPARSERERSSS